jgi:hypothetical protein
MREKPNWRAALWLRRHRILGRRTFIWRIVVGRLAFPAAALVTAGRLVYEPLLSTRFLAHALGNAVAAVVGGYIAGLILWDLVVSRGGRRSPEPEPQPTSRHQAR